MDNKAWRALQERKNASTIESGGRVGSRRAENIWVGGHAVRYLMHLDPDFWLEHAARDFRNYVLSNDSVTTPQINLALDYLEAYAEYLESMAEPGLNEDQLELEF